jgi:hypothetical protein
MFPTRCAKERSGGGSRAAIVQPGLAGLKRLGLDLAPLFTAAFATRASWPTYRQAYRRDRAGISMFAEALSDCGSLTGRGSQFAASFAAR